MPPSPPRALAGPGPVASGHVEVARRVAHGATAGVTMEPAAISRRLAFAAAWRSTWRSSGSTRGGASIPRFGGAGELLRSAAFTARLALVGGYDSRTAAPRVRPNRKG